MEDFENVKSRVTLWVQREGKEMVEASPVERAELMVNFVAHLLCDHYVPSMSIGWVVCAEVYANALLIKEVDRLLKGKETN